MWARTPVGWTSALSPRTPRGRRSQWQWSPCLPLPRPSCLARFLGVTLLGIFILIRAFPEAVQQVLDCRTRETIVKYLGEFVALDQRERAGALVRLVWLVDACAGLVAMAIVFVTAGVASRYVVHDPSATWLVAVYAVSQFVGTLDSASGSVVRVFDRFGIASAMSISQAVVRFGGILTALLLGGGLASLIYVLVAVEVAYTLGSMCISLTLLRRRIGFSLCGRLAAIRERRKEVLRFLLNTNIAGTLKMSTDKLVLVIIGALGGAPVAAQFKVATQTGGSLMLFSDPFYQVIYPSLSKMVARGQWAAVFAGLKRMQRIIYAVALPLGAIITVLIIYLIVPVFGEEFRPAIWPGVVILWAVIPNVLFFWLRPLLLSLSESARLAKYRGIASALQLGITLLLVGPWGTLGAAAGMFVMQWLYAGLEMALVIRRRRRLLEEAPTA